MKIQDKTLGIDVDVDNYSDEDLYKLHSYYYQQGLKDVAQRFIDVIENRKNKPEEKIGKPDEDK